MLISSELFPTMRMSLMEKVRTDMRCFQTPSTNSGASLGYRHGPHSRLRHLYSEANRSVVSDANVDLYYVLTLKSTCLHSPLDVY